MHCTKTKRTGQMFTGDRVGDDGGKTWMLDDDVYEERCLRDHRKSFLGAHG